MSSFSAFSELPLASALTTLSATAYIIGVSAASSAGILDYDAKANITTSSVASTFVTVPLSDVDAKANININTASANVALNVVDYTLKADASIAGLSTTSVLNSLSYTLTTKPVLASSSASFSSGSLDYNSKANIIIDAATATLTPHQFTAYDDVKGAFGAYISGAATATFSLGASASGNADIIPSTVTSTFVAGVLDYHAKASIILDATTADADLTVNTLEDEDAQATATVGGVSATTTADWDTVNGVYAINVVYLSTDFERSRTVNIVPYGNYTVFVTDPEFERAKTVNVVPYGNYTVYVTR
jgi:hypothetical protein